MGSIKEFASTLMEETKWHGNHNNNGKQLILKAGKLSMVYENGNLRYISTKNSEVLRMIYSAVRDRSWITIRPVISDELFEINPDSFKIKYSALYEFEEIAFQAHYSITGNPDNSLIVSFEGEALNDFEKNRIGFCVLHPIESNKGKKCIIVHSSGTTEEMTFPYEISPHQPFLDIKSMSWEMPSITCSLDFFGDVFETEDHRNWTDASYKTYCTPLSYPTPAKILKGQKLSQKIVLAVNAGSDVVDINERQINITIDRENPIHLPKIGIGRSTRIYSLTEGEAEVLGKIEFDHYRIDLLLFNNDWKSIADKAISEAEMMGYKMEMALFLDEDYLNQIELFIEYINRKKNHPVIVNLYHKKVAVIPDLVSDEIALRMKKAIPDIKVCCGTNANFAQINRNRPLSLHADFICYSIHPQEHASDNLSLVENLQAQGYTVESAKLFSTGKGIWISPVNIQRRFNANKENYEQTLNYSCFPAQADSRLMSLFGASWTAVSIKYLSESGAEGITYFETIGERGIYHGDFPSRWPNDFISVKGMIFPVYHLFKFISDNKAFEVISSQSSDPLTIDVLALLHGINLKIILVNFTGDIQIVKLDDISGEFNMKQLNAVNFADAVSDPNWYNNSSSIRVDTGGKIIMEPFSLNFIEGKILRGIL
jgi:D-apionolactonase